MLNKLNEKRLKKLKEVSVMDFLYDLTKKDWIILGIGLTVGAVLMYGYNRYCPLGRIDYEESKKPKKIRKTSKND